MTSTDRTPSTAAFERRLGEELIAMAAERTAERTTERAAGSTAGSTVGSAATVPAPRRALLRRPLPAALAVGAAAVATAVVLPAVLGGGQGGNAAYAVTEESDGTFLLELRDPTGLSDMVAELRGHGVKAAGLKHVQGTADDHCPDAPDQPSRAPAAVRSEPGDHAAERIDPSRIPAGATVLLRFWSYDADSPGAWVFNATVVDTVPACLPALRGTEVSRQSPVPVPSDAPPSGVPSGGATPVPTAPVPSGTGIPTPSGSPGGRILG
ncbi:hypothetical protein OU787_09720 [Kitasatospora sp. YST-16]|uniref:hypothetical protein n=1 Tax=Kitasatospora sp. YST-16 TaxID=2998080 RepID=UPI002284F4E4|nr:hypothetical protein [Kitasatospora sp. YST-16]WAL71759.1 hypothetical protein OU787_09720 [Kitasatospora sp. YST-16]WNW37800.1 hypothetical protein RKE32_09680 [Streptomyces sp. Li-HN-5-13]